MQKALQGRGKASKARAMAAKAERRGQPSHREDLRSELLAAAVNYVTAQGHEDLSMRKLAELVGVSSGAPYHHFADRRALLTAVALEGYEAMFRHTALTDSADAAAGTAGTDVLYRIFVDFLRFAAENPHMFTLMYESELVRPKLCAELAAAQDVGFQLLRKEVECLTEHLSERERALRIATIWSAIFGFALQSNRAMLRAHPFEPAPNELAPEIVRQALRLLD